jgi:phosphopantetheine adenylyltransferase
MFIRDLYEAPAKRIVAVMPGGFHPFHPGHKSLYDWAVKTFGQGNVYVAATNDTAARPFPFDVKKKLAGMAGVPGSNFIQVKSPFNAMMLLHLYLYAVKKTKLNILSQTKLRRMASQDI